MFVFVLLFLVNVWNCGHCKGSLGLFTTEVDRTYWKSQNFKQNIFGGVLGLEWPFFSPDLQEISCLNIYSNILLVRCTKKYLVASFKLYFSNEHYNTIRHPKVWMSREFSFILSVVWSLVPKVINGGTVDPSYSGSWIVTADLNTHTSSKEMLRSTNHVPAIAGCAQNTHEGTKHRPRIKKIKRGKNYTALENKWEYADYNLHVR